MHCAPLNPKLQYFHSLSCKRRRKRNPWSFLKYTLLPTSTRQSSSLCVRKKREFHSASETERNSFLERLYTQTFFGCCYRSVAPQSSPFSVSFVLTPEIAPEFYSKDWLLSIVLPFQADKAQATIHSVIQFTGVRLSSRSSSLHFVAFTFAFTVSLHQLSVLLFCPIIALKRREWQFFGVASLRTTSTSELLKYSEQFAGCTPCCLPQASHSLVCSPNLQVVSN